MAKTKRDGKRRFKSGQTGTQTKQSAQSAGTASTLRPYDFLTFYDKDLFSAMVSALLQRKEEATRQWARLLLTTAKTDESTGAITALFCPIPIPLPSDVVAAGSVTVERVYRTDAEVIERMGDYGPGTEPHDRYTFPSRADFDEVCDTLRLVIKQPEMMLWGISAERLSTFLSLLSDEKNLRFDGGKVVSTFPALVPGYDGPPVHCSVFSVERVFLPAGWNAASNGTGEGSK